MKEPEDTADKRFYLDAGKSAVGHKRLSKVQDAESLKEFLDEEIDQKREGLDVGASDEDAVEYNSDFDDRGSAKGGLTKLAEESTGNEAITVATSAQFEDGRTSGLKSVYDKKCEEIKS